MTTYTSHKIKTTHSGLDVEVAANVFGDIFVFHANPLKENLEWSEFNPENGLLSFFNKQGKIHDLTLTIIPELREYMKVGEEIHLAWITNNDVKSIIQIPLVINIE